MNPRYFVRLAIAALAISSLTSVASTSPIQRSAAPRVRSSARAGWTKEPWRRVAWKDRSGPFTDPAASRAAKASLARIQGARPAAHGSVASVPDGAGGTYVAWEDTRDGLPDIYLLRVTNAGAAAAGWPATGLAVCAAAGAQIGPFMIPDGSNGVIVAWQDLRNGWFGGEGWAQRVSSAGVPAWTADGVKFGSNFFQLPSVAPDGSGGMLVAWGSLSPANIYAVRINSTGAVQAGWSAAGTVVCAAPDSQLNPVIANDNAGGAIVAWEDDRDGDGNTNIFAQRMNSSGAAQWTANGIQVDAATFANDPAIVPDGAGGAMVCWWESNILGQVNAQRLNSAGAGQWGAGGVDISGTLLSSEAIQAIPDGLGGMIAYWVSGNLSGGTDMLGQRVNSSGTTQWGASAATIAGLGPTAFPEQIDAAADGAGGALFTWLNSDPANSPTSILIAQKIASNGSAPWAPGGIAVAYGFQQTVQPSVAPDGSTGAVVLWPEFDRLQDVTIRIQRFNAAGTPSFPASIGGVVFADPCIQNGAATVSDGVGGAWVAWTDKSSGNFDVHARHVTSGGISTGPTIAVTAIAGDQVLQGAVSDGAGGVILGWGDYASSTDHNVYAQRLNSSGVPQWGAGGLAVCNAVKDQEFGSMISDGAGGAILTWTDYRNENFDGNSDIFAQRINGAGAVQWGANGLGVCTDAQPQVSPLLVPIAGGGATVVWSDYRGFPTGLGLYGQKVNGAGVAQWTTDGISLMTVDFYSQFGGAVTDGADGLIALTTRYAVDMVTELPDTTELKAFRFNSAGAGQWGAGLQAYYEPGYSAFPLMVADGTGGALITWGDGRAPGAYDVYLQRITGAGARSYGVGGAVVCNAASWQLPTGLYATGSGDGTVSWSDERAGLADTYAQRIANTGTAAWTANGVLLSNAPRGQYGVSGTPDNASGGLFSWTDYRSGTERLIYSQRLSSLGAPAWTANGVVPVLVSLVSASTAPGSVTIDWQVDAGTSATVFRSTDGALWEARAQIVAGADGRVRFEDRDVTAGAHVGYRVGTGPPGAEVFGGEVWVDVPAGAVFALRGLVPNPGTGPLNVSFALATAERARLEMVDVAGRVVMVRDVTGWGPGDHVLTLDRGDAGPGVYFLRLTQGAHREVRRAVLVN